jgi:hypothetical protein
MYTKHFIFLYKRQRSRSDAILVMSQQSVQFC